MPKLYVHLLTIHFHLSCHIRFLLREQLYIADDSGDKLRIHKKLSAISEVTNIHILFTLFLTY